VAQLLVKRPSSQSVRCVHELGLRFDVELSEETEALDRYLSFGPADLHSNLRITPPERHAPQEFLFARAQY
jgi:hypothetical protein